MSHRKAWRDFLASEDDWRVIVEDDISFTGHYQNLVDQIIKKAAPRLNMGLVKLYTPRSDEPGNILAPLGANHKLLRYTSFPMTTAAYLISRVAAQRLLSATTKIDTAVDNYLSQAWRHGVTNYGIAPNLVEMTDLGQSTSIADRKKTKHFRVIKVYIELTRLYRNIRLFLYNLFY